MSNRERKSKSSAAPSSKIRLSKYPMLTKKAFLLPTGGEEEAFRGRTHVYLGKIYEHKVAGNFDDEEDSQFQRQFSKLIEEYKKFAAKHYAELVKTHRSLEQSHRLTQTHIDTLDVLKRKVANGTFYGIEVETDQSSEEEKIRHRDDFFQKLKNKLEEILFSVVTRLEEQKEGNARQIVLRQIADTYVHFYFGFASNVCTAGALGAVETQHNKWCGRNDVAGILLSMRKTIVQRLAEEYVEECRAQKIVVHEASETHIPQNYRRVFAVGGAGIPAELEDKFRGAGGDAKEAVVEAAQEDLREKFPQEYNYETVCEAVAQVEYKKYKAIIDKYGAPDKDFNPVKNEFKKEMEPFLNYHICTEADLIISEEVNGVEVFKINPTLSGKLLGYCRRYSPKILQQEGFVTDIDQCLYLARDHQGTTKVSLSQLLQGLEVMVHAGAIADVNTWEIQGTKGDNFLTHALREGKFYKFMALLHKMKGVIVEPSSSSSSLSSSSSSLSAASAAQSSAAAASPSSSGIRAADPAATVHRPMAASAQLYFNPKVADATGLTPLAVIVNNRPWQSLDSKERYLTPGQQTLALRFVLDHPAIIVDDLTAIVGKGKQQCLLRDVVAQDNCPVEVFSLFWQGLYEKTRYSYQLELGHAAKQEAEQSDDSVTERKERKGAANEASIEEIARLGAKELKQSDPEQVDAHLGKMLTDYANKKNHLGQSGIIAIAVAGNFYKAHRLLSLVPNLELDSIKKLEVFEGAFKDLDKPISPKIKPTEAKEIHKLRKLLFLPRRIRGGFVQNAKAIFLSLVREEDAKRGAAAGPPPKNLQAYQDLLAIVCKQCSVEQVKAFIAEMAKDEDEMGFRLALADKAPDVVDLSNPRRLVLSNGQVVEDTVLRVMIRQKEVKKVEQLLEWDVDPSVEVKGESALALAATPGVLDVQQQQRIIPLLLASKKFSPAQRSSWLIQMAASRHTYTGFATVWEQAKDEIKLRSGPIFDEKIGFLRYVYLEREKQEVVAKWDEYKVGEIDPALRLQVIAELINAFEPKPEDILQQMGCQACRRDGLRALIAFIAQIKERRAQEIAKFIRAQLQAPTSVDFGVVAPSAVQLQQHTPRAAMLLGAGSTERVKFIEQSYPSLVNQPDALGYNVIYYLARDNQHDKLETLLVEVAGLDFSQVWRLPGITQEQKLDERDKTSVMRHLLRLIYALQQGASYNYVQAKALFLALSPANVKCYPYATLIQIIVNQCQETHPEFFTKLVEEAEADASCLLAINRKMGNVDLMRVLVKATAPTCDLQTFKNIVDSLKQANQWSLGEVVFSSSVAIRADTTAEVKQPKQELKLILTPLLIKNTADFKLQFAKFKCLLLTVPVMHALAAYYPAQNRRFQKNSQDILIDLLLAAQQQHWSVAIAHYLIYLEKMTEPGQAANHDGIFKEILDIIKIQFGDSAVAAFKAAEKNTANRFCQVAVAIKQQRYLDAEKLFLAEEKQPHADKLSEDLSLVMSLYWIENKAIAGEAGNTNLETFCNGLLKIFTMRPELQTAIIVRVYELNVMFAARLFCNHFVSREGSLLPEQILQENIERILIQFKECYSDNSIINKFLETLFNRLLQEKTFCQYKQYPKLLWQALQRYGCADLVFNYQDGPTTIRENPLSYFLRTYQYDAAKKLIEDAKDGDIGVDNSDSQGIFPLMHVADIKETGARQEWLDHLLKLKPRKETLSSKDAKSNTMLIRFAMAGDHAAVAMLLQYASQLYAGDLPRFKVFVAHKNLASKTAFTIAREAKQDAIVLNLLECTSIDENEWQLCQSFKSPAHQFSTYNVTQLLSLLHSRNFEDENLLSRGFDACFPHNYNMQEVGEQVARLLKIIANHVPPERYTPLIAVLWERYLTLPVQQNIAVLTTLVRMAPNVQLMDGYGQLQPLLPYTVLTDNPDLFNLLLECKVDVNQSNAQKETALLLTCSSTNLDEKAQLSRVDRLLELKADARIKTKGKPARTVFDVALKSDCHFQTFLRLYEHDEDGFPWAGKISHIFQTEIDALQPRGKPVDAERKRKIALTRNKQYFSELHQALAFDKNIEVPSKYFLQLMGSLDPDTLLRILQVIEKITTKRFSENFKCLIEHLLNNHGRSLSEARLRPFLFSLLQIYGKDLANGDSLLHWLFKQKTTQAYDYAKELIDSKQIDSAAAQVPNKRGYTPLMVLLQEPGEDSGSYLALVTKLIPLCRPLQAKSVEGSRTALIYAVRHLRAPALSPGFSQILAETKGEDVLNWQDVTGHAALRYAVDTGELWKVQRLLEVKEINRLLEDKQGVSPIEAAHQSNKNEIVAAFFTQDADDKIKHYLVNKYHQQSIAGVRISPALTQLASEAFYRCYLQAAAQNRQAEVITQLLERYNKQPYYSVWCMDLLELNLSAALGAGHLQLLKVLLMGAGGVAGMGDADAKERVQSVRGLHVWLQRFDRLLPSETIQALYADPHLKPLWLSAALVFAKDFARKTSVASVGELAQLQALLPVVEQMITNALHWPRRLTNQGEVNVVEILDCLEQGRRKILDAPAPYSLAFKEAVAAGRDDVVYWLLTRGAAQPYLIDVNEPEEKGRDPIIFWILQQAQASKGDLRWLRIAETIIKHPTWRSDLLDHQGTTVLMKTATYPQLFKTVLAATSVTTQLLEDKERKSAMDYVMASCDAAKASDAARAMEEIGWLQARLPAELKAHTQRIERAQQEPPDYAQAQRIGIEITKYYHYTASHHAMLGRLLLDHLPERVLPVDSAKALLQVMQEPTEVNFARLRPATGADAKAESVASVPEYLEIYRLFFRCQLVLAPTNCQYFIAQDLLFNQASAAIEKFMVLYDAQLATMPDGWFVARLASIQQLAPPGQFLEFCELLLNKLAIRALTAGNFGVVKMLVKANNSGSDMTHSDMNHLGSLLLAAPIPLSWERVIAVKNDDEKILTPAWPFAALAFAKAFARNEPGDAASLTSATAVMELVLKNDENIGQFAQEILQKTLVALHAGFSNHVQSNPAVRHSDIKPLQIRMEATFKQLLEKKDNGGIVWLLQHNRLTASEETKERSALPKSASPPPAAFFPVEVKAGVRGFSPTPPVLLINPWMEVSKGKSFVVFCLDLAQGFNRERSLKYLKIMVDDVWMFCSQEQANNIFMRAVNCDIEVFTLLITRTPIENLVLRNPATQKTWMDWMLKEGNYGPHIHQHAQCLADTQLAGLRSILPAIEAPPSKASSLSLTLAAQIADELLKFHAFILKPLVEKAEKRFGSSLMGPAAEQLKYKAVQALQLALSRPTAENTAALVNQHKGVAKLVDFKDLFNAVHTCITKLPPVSGQVAQALSGEVAALAADMDMF